MRRSKNEDSRPLNQTQPTSVNSSCHKGIQRNAFLLKNDFCCNIYNNKLSGCDRWVILNRNIEF